MCGRIRITADDVLRRKFLANCQGISPEIPFNSAPGGRAYVLIGRSQISQLSWSEPYWARTESIGKKPYWDNWTPALGIIGSVQEKGKWFSVPDTHLPRVLVSPDQKSFVVVTKQTPRSFLDKYQHGRIPVLERVV
jgi:hypothetical protein